MNKDKILYGLINGAFIIIGLMTLYISLLFSLTLLSYTFILIEMSEVELTRSLDIILLIGFLYWLRIWVRITMGMCKNDSRKIIRYLKKRKRKQHKKLKYEFKPKGANK